MPAMEIWRRAAKTASFRCMLACVGMAGEAQSRAMLEGAHEHLVSAEAAAARGFHGLPPEPGDRICSGDAWTAKRNLELAIGRTERVVAVHARCGELFSLCATSMAVQESAMAPWWHEWRRRHALAAAHARDALEWIRDASTHGDSAMGGLCLLQVMQPPDWDEWGPRILIQLDHAKEAIYDAQAVLELLEQALIVEYATARRLLRQDIY